MRFGLTDSDLKYISDAISEFPEIEKAAIFGSRAKGNFKPGSDIDIAIYGENVNFDTVSKLHSMLEEESPMPYFFDIVDYTHSENEDIKNHIEIVGKTIYKKNDY